MALPRSLTPVTLGVLAIAMIVWACLPSIYAAGEATFEIDVPNCTDPQAFAEDNTFYVNDVLVIKFTPGCSILEVNQTAFVDGQTTNPIREYKNNRALIRLSATGPRYFISDGSENCLFKLSFNVTSGNRPASDKTIKRCQLP